MAASEVIYVVAASLWIFVVLAAFGVGCYFIVKFRRRWRRMNLLFDVVRVPIQFGAQVVLLARRCESAGRTFGVLAGNKVVCRLQVLISELHSGRPEALFPGNRRR